MSFFLPQNPGIGGLDELTLSEELVVQTIAALGSPGYVLRTNLAGTAIEWAAAGSATLGDGDYGDITVSGGGTIMNIDAATIGITELSATGTPSATTYLRGDNTWATISAGGDVTKVGTPVNNQVGVWTGDGTIEGDTALTFDTTTDTLAIAASGKLAFGAVDILSDSAGTMTLSNIDALDATTEATIEAAIDTLANLTSIGSFTGVLRADSGALSVDSDVTDIVAAATALAAGKVELATDAETVTGTDTQRATTPANITARLAAPGTIGGTTPGAATFTSVTTTGNIELGNASDTTISRSSAGVIAVEGVVIPSISSTNTLTNKRITKRVGSTTSSATPTINTDNVDAYHLTAQAVDITSFTTNLTGTPTDFQQLRISVTGTAARAITWGSSFANGPVALPTTTVSTTRLDVLFEWDSVTSKWRCMASGSTV